MTFIFEPHEGDRLSVDPDELDAVDYSSIPYIPRRWLWEGYIPFGNPVLFAAAGGTGKGMLMCAVAARVVLGLPFPGEDPLEALGRGPGRVVYIAGSEDDPFEDLAPRFRAAVAVAVAGFGLDPRLAEETGAIRLIHDLSAWKDDSPFEVPGDMGRLLTETGKLSQLDKDNLPAARTGLPPVPVAMVVIDPLADLLGEHDHVTSVRSARKVMRGIKQFARQADVAVPIIHHLTKDGKVSGSPAVVDALRLAYMVERAKDDPETRVIRPVKANITKGEPQQYVITGDGPGAHAEFVDAAGARAERVASAQERSAAPVAGSRSARMREARALDAEGAPFRVLRQTEEPGSKPQQSRVGTTYPTRAAARDAALRDAGTLLTWKPSQKVPLGEMAVIARADGARRGYVLVPTPKPAQRPAPSGLRDVLPGARA